VTLEAWLNDGWHKADTVRLVPGEDVVLLENSMQEALHLWDNCLNAYLSPTLIVRISKKLLWIRSS
jgi:hypothetical protein